MVKNLFTLEEVILSRQDIFKIAQYAIQNNIIDITFNCEEAIGLSDNYDGTRNLYDFSYELEYIEPSEDDEDAVSS